MRFLGTIPRAMKCRHCGVLLVWDPQTRKWRGPLGSFTCGYSKRQHAAVEA